MWGAPGIAFALLALILWPYRSMVPMWDGWVYARCVLDAPIIALRCAGHPALAWSAPMALAKFVTWQRITPTFVPNLLFAAVSIAGWARLLTRVLPEAEAATERSALVLLFALHPGVLSTVLQPSMDLAILAWGL